MSLPPHIQFFFANHNIHLNDTSGYQDNPSAPHEGSRTRQSQNFVRLSQKIADFAYGRGEEKLNSLLGGSVLGQSSANFWASISRATGWNLLDPHPEQGSSAASTPSADELGGTLHRSFGNMLGVVPDRLAAIVEARSEQITNELEDFKRSLTAYYRSDRTGPPPTAPRSIPSHLRDLMTQLDPADPEYAKKIVEMVQVDADIQQSARQQMNNIIGSAPRHRPRREHNVDGAQMPELDPNGEPLFESSQEYERPVAYENPPTPSPNERVRRGYQAPHVQEVADDDLLPPPLPPKVPL